MLVGVIGAGIMGAGIAQAFAAVNDNRVILCDMNLQFADSGKKKILDRMAITVKKGKMTEKEASEISDRICVDEISSLSGCDLVIEAVKEDMTVKKTLFASLVPVCRKDCIFASNTSALSLTAMSEGLDRPIVGLHFFNPVPQMKLVEIIVPKDASEALVNSLKSMMEVIGKVPVTVQDSAGFVVNRLLIPMINEAIGVYADSVASAEDIDTAMKLGANHPIGPLALGDLIGLDVCLAIMEVLEKELQDIKYKPHTMLVRMVQDGKLGRKSGKGFYEYNK